jgi:hypothetical protein
MPLAIRSHLDENVHLTVAEALRRRGIDVTTPSDAASVGAAPVLLGVGARPHGRFGMVENPRR